MEIKRATARVTKVPAKRGTLNHLRLTVTDIPRAESFYDPILRLMGFELAEKSDDRLAWATMTATGNLQWTVLSRAREQVKNKRHERYSAGLHHVAWNAESREEVDQMYKHLVGADAEILDPPAEYDYWLTGYYAVFFRDPDGLKLEYVYIPAAGSADFWQKFKSRGVNPVVYVGDGSGDPTKQHIEPPCTTHTDRD